MTEHMSSVVALGWLPYFDQPTKMKQVTILGRKPYLADVLFDAATGISIALDTLDYENPCDWTGGFNPRPIAGTDLWSKHSYGMAVDLDYGGFNPESPEHPGVDKNPHIHRRIYPGDPGFGVQWQILEHQVRAVEAIKNKKGQKIWRWLGWSIGDTMHFEAMVRPEDCQVDWSTVKGADDMPSYAELRADEFDLWTATNIMEAFDDGMFESSDRAGFEAYWVTQRSQRTIEEKARFMTDFYSHLRK